MKAILLSINPEHALNILECRKTLELRKKVPKDFVGWVYVYVTKGGKRLAYEKQPKRPYYILSNSKGVHSANGTIPFRFWFDEYEQLTFIEDRAFPNNGYYETSDNFELEKLCLTWRQIHEYGKGKDLYAWHIKKLEIFDKPMRLSELYGKQKITKAQLDFISRHQVGDENYEYYRLTKAPQSYQYVWVKE